VRVGSQKETSQRGKEEELVRSLEFRKGIVKMPLKICWELLP